MPPAGYKRSRALWDESRRPGASWRDTLRAILYEIQPIRLPKAQQRRKILRGWYDRIVYIWIYQSIPTFGKACGSQLMVILRWMISSPQHGMVFPLVIGYAFFVRWMHELLLAGPLILTLTCLGLIFTIGLGDSEEDEVVEDGRGRRRRRPKVSAYAIFNRGFERLLGSVDVDALVAQHVGGGAVGGGIVPPAGVAVQRDQWDDDDNGHPRGGLRRRQPEQQQENANQNNPREDGGGQPQNRARKSGKKARRKDITQRREIMNQRQAAADLGLEHDHAMEEHQEALLMEQLMDN